MLQEYNLNWEFVKGSDNIAADTLSRVDPMGGSLGRDIKEIPVYVLTKSNKLFKKELAGIEQMQRNNTSLRSIIMALETNTSDNGLNEHFQLYKGLLFKKVEGLARDWKLMIPEQLIGKIVWDCHKRYGHFGPRKCYQALKESCIFKNMEKRTRQILKVCKLYQKLKASNVQ